MGWTPLYLEMQNKNVLVVGAGEVGQRRALRFLDAGANVVMSGGHVPPELEKLGTTSKPRAELPKWIDWADLVVVASGDPQLNQEVAHLAKDKLINRADHPEEGNLIVPSSFFIKDVQFSIFTQGKSPLMARQLRKRIQTVIQEEDILKMELQHFTRQLLKEKVQGQKKRRDYLYQILNDKKINELLDNGKLEEARTYVTLLLETQY
ncbi:precorrin-2 dehydrogenase/sirohydrochlorin ferrochelatase family protein [Methanobacterium sp.]|uniref:precorrin-2 dehydrogenase/sirohydrochlorin ferrochelatase family protein n=1 Tax=Methanobacterium sp. TaxID=2164 RepID=UPI0025F44948|nr:bifunctional precorrin-2 dehydrogenase/sirohydrochlorin ferrochelatase [Methanobacterium sp.]MBI5459283.1 bifunctional precorrin-2 dehydrogenase/sirohydrochlorin ferrochelatase [Methanobacterium sp.]MDY9923765.1 bifunctional precorrin-2 dehydrogenase/sirohydrochlorin ferrochelatase [Methanobacterium sp.]